MATEMAMATRGFESRREEAHIATTTPGNGRTQAVGFSEYSPIFVALPLLCRNASQSLPDCNFLTITFEGWIQISTVCKLGLSWVTHSTWMHHFFL